MRATARPARRRDDGGAARILARASRPGGRAPEAGAAHDPCEGTLTAATA